MSRAATLDKPVVPFNVDGFVSCRDQRSHQYKPGEMELVVNMLPEARDRPSKLLMRPGYKRYCASGAASAVQVGVSTGGVSQAIDGYFGSTFKSLIITDSGIYSLDHTTYGLTTELTSAQAVAAGATWPPQRVIFFNNKLVCSTIGGKPFTWNGTTGAGVALIANFSRSFAYDVAVYGGRVVFVYNSANANELLWSEPGDETIGYATAPYSNFWPLQQTSQNTLGYIVGTNDGLFFGRGVAGIGMIRGDNDANWQTTSTKDELSDRVGVGATATPQGRPQPGGSQGSVVFVDQLSRPMIYRPSKGLVHLWEQLPRLFGETRGATWDLAPWAFEMSPSELDINTFTQSCIGIWYDKAAKANAFAFNTGVANLCIVLLFDVDSDRFVGAWTTTMTGSTSLIGFLGYLDFQNGVQPRPAPIKIDRAGFVYWQDNFNLVNPTRSWSEEISNGAGVPVVGTIIGPPHGSNPTLKYWFDRVDVLVDARATHTVRLGYVTSAKHKGALTPADLTFTESGNTNTPYQVDAEFGLEGDVLARWLMPQIQVEALAGQDQQCGVYGYRIEARPDAQNLGAL